MNENWKRWITASFNKHFADNDSSYTLVFEGDQITTELANQDHAEIRLDSDVVLNGKDHYFTIFVNILCVTSMVAHDLYKIERMVGKYMSAFTTSINVKKYGDNPDDSIGCATLKNKISITRFSEVNNMQRVSLEGEYLLIL
jgi:hypothetical protein